MTDPNQLDELATLGRVLDQYRETIVWKLDGLTESQARWNAVPSGTSLLGIVKHLGYTEREWFQNTVGGRDLFLPFDEANPAGDWELSVQDTTDSIVGFYEAECRASRAIMDATTDPEARVNWGGRRVTVRRVAVHMLEETARHAGHMDIIREQLDGATGAFPS